jgi:hypothetical protein
MIYQFHIPLVIWKLIAEYADFEEPFHFETDNQKTNTQGIQSKKRKWHDDFLNQTEPLLKKIKMVHL